MEFELNVPKCFKTASRNPDFKIVNYKMLATNIKKIFYPLDQILTNFIRFFTSGLYYSFIYSFIQYLMSSYYMPDIIVGGRDITENKRDKNLYLICKNNNNKMC